MPTIVNSVIEEHPEFAGAESMPTPPPPYESNSERRTETTQQAEEILATEDSLAPQIRVAVHPTAPEPIYNPRGDAYKARHPEVDEEKILKHLQGSVIL